MNNIDISNLLNILTADEKRQLDTILAMPTTPDLLEGTFPLQREFILDDSKLKALFCTRRSGKSLTAGIYLIKSALDFPGTSQVYISLTRDQAKRIVWNDVFKALCKRHNLDVRYNETELTLTFPNGSIIYIVGCNDGPAEMEKLLGKKFKTAILDESASFTVNLKDLVYKVLKPACSDYRGTIACIGTPSDRLGGLFYDLTRDITVQPPQVQARDGWKIWSWDAYQNPYMREQWGETIRDLERNDPHVHEQAWFKQMYLAQWVAEDTNRIYRYTDDRNAWDGKLPDYGYINYNWVLGIDMGFQDASALVLMASHPHDRNTYVVRAKKWRGLTLTQLADKIREWAAEYPINYFICDGANKQGVEEIVRHQQLPLVAAEKQDKVTFIKIMNSEFVSGHIKIDTVQCAELVDEYNKAIWNRLALERGIYREDTSFHGDLTDAALYGYRYTYNYAATPAPTPQSARTPEEIDIERFGNEYGERQGMEGWGDLELFI